MTKQLYDEALADVKKLKEVAEDNAKKALIEAVAPRIKDLIEAELLRETEESPENLLLDDGEDDPAMASLGGMEPDLDGSDKVTLDLDTLSIAPEDGDDDDVDTGMDDDVVLSNESKQALQALLTKSNGSVFLKLESKVSRLNEKLGSLLDTPAAVRQTKTYKNLVNEMVSEVEDLYQHLQESVPDSKNKMLYENKLEKIYKDLNQLTEQKMKNRLMNEEAFTFTLDLGDDLPDEASEALKSALSKASLEIAPEGESDEGDEELDLEDEGEGEEEDEGGEEEEKPEGDEEGEDELDLSDLGDEESKEGEEPVKESRRLSDNVIVEIDEGMLRHEISRMKALRESTDDVQDWGHGAGDVSHDMDFEDEDLGDPLDMDLSEGADDDKVSELEEMDMDEGGMDEADLDELMQADDVKQMGGNHDKSSSGQARQAGETVKESLRRRLAAEQRLQLEAKKKAKKAKMKEQQAKKAAAEKKQAAAMKEQAAQKAAQKKQAKEAAQKKAAAKKDLKEAALLVKQAGQLKEAYDFFATKFNESVRRTSRLQAMLTEASQRNGQNLNGGQSRSSEDADNLRKKLAETNLFNMKLLYTNKLLQNESLTKRQKADVIERLDEAATDREVKLVYESLVKTLGGKTGNLTEGANRVLGSSSAPTRPASTLINEGYEADRWAKLAGIK
jgi:hypothetical protein